MDLKLLSIDAGVATYKVCRTQKTIHVAIKDDVLVTQRVSPLATYFARAPSKKAARLEAVEYEAILADIEAGERAKARLVEMASASAQRIEDYATDRHGHQRAAAKLQRMRERARAKVKAKERGRAAAA